MKRGRNKLRRLASHVIALQAKVRALGLFTHDRDMPKFEWVAFHKIGLVLAARLKREVGDQARVVYSKAFEDPEHEHEEDIELHADGSRTVLPAYA